MNNTEKMYDEIISRHYDKDSFRLFSASRDITVKQIAKESSDMKIKTILDLAFGTGETLLAVSKLFPDANFYGIDLSEKMIQIAKSKMEVKTFHDDAINIKKYIKPNSIDLILIHFLLAYVNPETIFSEAVRLLRKGGLCSIATSTYESFKTLQALAGNFLSKDYLKQAQIPGNPDTLKKKLATTGFEVMNQQIFKKQLHFTNFNQLYDWGMKSSWLTHYLSNLTTEQIESIMPLAEKIFPIEDELQAVILIAKKM
jgi:ubiquinone/menaquinone biosynthesis C-methylase UbiE